MKTRAWHGIERSVSRKGRINGERECESQEGDGKGGWGVGGVGRGRERERENSNSNSKTLFSKDYKVFFQRL